MYDSDSDENTFEVAYGDNIYEGGLHDEFVSTNFGHKEFVPVKDFGLSHLPPKYQDIAVLEYFQKQADLSVLITTNSISKTRPVKFSSGQFRDTVPQVGTGFCWEVLRCGDKDSKQSGQPTSSGWEVRIYTNAHVVWDDKEAASTDVVFFYDDTDAETITVHGSRVEGTDIKKDRCCLVCVIHDGEMDELINKLKDLTEAVKRMSAEFEEKYGQEEKDEICVLISHPQGSTKQISVAEYVDDDETDSDNIDEIVWCYHAPTVPGSSEASDGWDYWGLGY